MVYWLYSFRLVSVNITRIHTLCRTRLPMVIRRWAGGKKRREDGRKDLDPSIPFKKKFVSEDPPVLSCHLTKGSPLSNRVTSRD